MGSEKSGKDDKHCSAILYLNNSEYIIPDVFNDGSVDTPDESRCTKILQWNIHIVQKSRLQS